MKDIIGVVYTVSFEGRKTGSIGVDYPITCEIKSDKELNNEELRLKVYEKYEHVQGLIVNKKEFLKGKRY